MQDVNLSVVICTYNPRRDYLDRTFASLRAQTLPTSEWELFVIDNSSDTPVASYLDLSWHQRARIIVEKKQGLTPARICGTCHSSGPIILFIDDDNVLPPDYMVNVLAIGQEYPKISVWGAATITPEYEKAPAADVAPFCSILALRDLGRDAWSNQPAISEYLPYGAGIALRRQLAEDFARQKEQSGLFLGRSGASLLSSEDYEFALLAAKNGSGHGIFERLKLTHLISARRVERDYLLRLYEAVSQSNVLVVFMHQEKPEPGVVKLIAMMRNLLPPLAKMVFHRGFARTLYFRVARGRWKAWRSYRNIAAALHHCPASSAT